MIQDIKYNGYSASPSDYECQDGDLACAVGLIPDAGAMTPVLPPKTLFTLSEGEKVVFIHETSAFKHYIISDEMTTSATLSWMNEGDSDTTTLSWVSGYVGVQAIGNTLMIICKERVLYFLWKNGAYENLGDHIPDVNISFGLVGHPRLYSISGETKSYFTISFNAISEDNRWNVFSSENKKTITAQVMAKVNKFVKEQTVDKGRFCFPFFVRYALRLYDGSLVGHSAPILMNPSTIACPVVPVLGLSGTSGYTSATLDIMLVAADIDYSVLSPEGHDLEDWSDIVSSVEVFISKPIYTYDQSGEVESFNDGDDISSTFIGRLYVNGLTDEDGSDKEDYIRSPFVNSDIMATLEDMYSEWQYRHIYAMYFKPRSAYGRWYPAMALRMPEFDWKNHKETIEKTSTFFKLCSVNIKDIAIDTRKKIDVPEDYLDSLVTREVMTDDYLSHDRLIPSSTFVYNQRVHLSGVKKKLFSGFPIRSMMSYCNYLYNWTTDDEKTINIEKLMIPQRKFSIKVLIKDGGETYGASYSASNVPPMLTPIASLVGQTFWEPLLLGSKWHYMTYNRSWGSYFFYPNANAYKMIIYDEVSRKSLVVDLLPHDFLNGAYALLDYNSQRDATDFDTSDVQFEALVSVPNKIYTSEVNNPFYFPLLGINTIGTGDILGISTAAKALSEGQFGQFPLYAFTTDGVWALEVSDTGSYSARQPITRDVCINADSITQIDSAVLFATDRGIMLLQGSESICISDILDSKEGFAITDLPWGEQLVSKSGLAQTDFNIVPFREFLAGCRMLYDYTHQHIIVYNPNHTYAYVYSLESKAWGMTHSDIASGVNSYPEALAMTHAGELVDFSHSDVTQGLKGVLVTRPFKLGAPDLHKTIDTIIQRGHFRKGHIKVALYGSRNLYDWFLISSSIDHYLRGFRGTPYKYFRLALLCELDHDESVYGCTIQYTPRLINQPR